MGTSYPAAFDVLTNPTGTDPLTSPSHADQHINANDIVEAIEQRVGLSGSAFPGGPSSGQFFYRTDRRLEYFYDGTRWLTTAQYEMVIPVSTVTFDPVSATASNHQVMAPHAGAYDLWLETFFVAFYVTGGTALSASHKWVVELRKTKDAGTTIAATVTVSSGAIDSYRISTAAIDALLDPTHFVLYIQSTKTGTPGSLSIWPSFTYRLVG